MVDSAVAFWLGERLSRRNQPRFSSYAFAYRSDRNAHHAIAHLQQALSRKRRLYVVEYDFADYFGSIRHDYVLDVLRRKFDVSRRERFVIEQLLRTPALSFAEYTAGGSAPPTKRGIPQGSSISLFLANVACHELDLELERQGAAFARYGDDTVILAESYQTANACIELMLAHGERSGAALNLKKSPGMRLCTSLSTARSEFEVIDGFDFLGHRLTRDGVRLSSGTLCRMKQTISKIINQTLLHYGRRHSIASSRIGPAGEDWDLVSCIGRIRSYLYGAGATEESISLALRNEGPAIAFPSAFLFFPMVDNAAIADLKDLDGWILNALARAYSVRQSFLQKQGFGSADISASKLRSGAWWKGKPEVSVTIPSAVRAWRYSRRVAAARGVLHLPTPKSEGGAFDEDLLEADLNSDEV